MKKKKGRREEGINKSCEISFREGLGQETGVGHRVASKL